MEKTIKPKALITFQGSYKKCNHFSRTKLDFQGPPTGNLISQIVQKCTFPVYSNKTKA